MLQQGPRVKVRFTIMLFVLAGSLLAQVPKEGRLPSLRGEFLTGRQAILPDAAFGRVALLAIGFTSDSRFAVEAWVKQFRGDFGQNPQVTFFEVPMIGGMARMGKWFIDGGMRRGTPKADHEHVVTVYGDTATWKERAGFKAPDDAYLILLDRNGQVRWNHGVRFDATAYQGLAEATKRLLAESTE
jgi:hypothetical protein